MGILGSIGDAVGGAVDAVTGGGSDDSGSSSSDSSSSGSGSAGSGYSNTSGSSGGSSGSSSSGSSSSGSGSAGSGYSNTSESSGGSSGSSSSGSSSSGSGSAGSGYSNTSGSSGGSSGSSSSGSSSSGSGSAGSGYSNTSGSSSSDSSSSDSNPAGSGYSNTSASSETSATDDGIANRVRDTASDGLDRAREVSDDVVDTATGVASAAGDVASDPFGAVEDFASGTEAQPTDRLTEEERRNIREDVTSDTSQDPNNVVVNDVNVAELDQTAPSSVQNRLTDDQRAGLRQQATSDSDLFDSDDVVITDVQIDDGRVVDAEFETAPTDVDISRREQFGDLDFSFGTGDPDVDEVERAFEGFGRNIQQGSADLGDDLFEAAGPSIGEAAFDAAGREDLGDVYDEEIREFGSGIVGGVGGLIGSVPELAIEGTETAAFAATQPGKTVEQTPEAVNNKIDETISAAESNPSEFGGQIVGSAAATGGLFRATQGTRLGSASRVTLQPGEEVFKTLGSRGVFGRRARNYAKNRETLFDGNDRGQLDLTGLGRSDSSSRNPDSGSESGGLPAELQESLNKVQSTDPELDQTSVRPEFERGDDITATEAQERRLSAARRDRGEGGVDDRSRDLAFQRTMERRQNIRDLEAMQPEFDLRQIDRIDQETPAVDLRDRFRDSPDGDAVSNSLSGIGAAGSVGLLGTLQRPESSLDQMSLGIGSVSDINLNLPESTQRPESETDIETGFETAFETEPVTEINQELETESSTALETETQLELEMEREIETLLEDESDTRQNNSDLGALSDDSLFGTGIKDPSSVLDDIGI